MFKISLFQIAKESTLAGGSNGRLLVPELLKHLPMSADIQIVVLDFSNIRIATASYLREMILPFRDFVRRREAKLVIANCSELILEDLNEVMLARDEALLHCTLDDNGRPQNPRVIGPLDSGLTKVLETLSSHGEVDAPMLAKAYPDEGIGSTGWNNRLATLDDKGVLLMSRQGRLKRYSLILKGTDDGC